MYVAPGDFSSDDENELHGSDVGWCTVFKKAYCHRCNSFCFPNLYVRLYWIQLSGTRPSESPRQHERRTAQSKNTGPAPEIDLAIPGMIN